MAVQGDAPRWFACCRANDNFAWDTAGTQDPEKVLQF
jgi:hypothetical protein